MENNFYKNTFIIYNINPTDKSFLRKIIYIWNCPPLIKNLILESKFDNPSIKNYFGNDYKLKLGLENYENIENNIFYKKIELLSKLSSSASASASTSQQISGGDDDNDLIIKSSRTDDIENFNEDDVTISSTSDAVIDFTIDFDTPVSSSDDTHVQESIQEVKSGNEYVFNVSLYPEDTIHELKRKIYISHKIPIYRQLLFYNDTNIRTFYDITINDIIYKLSPLDDNIRFYNMGIDKKLYMSKDNLRVISKDEFTILKNLDSNYLYMIDLKSYIDYIGINIAKIINDKYYFDMMYHGFIKKYFPMLDYQAFHLFLTNESQIKSAYNLLYEDYDILADKLKREKFILDSVYTTKLKDIKNIEKNMEIICKSIKLGNTYYTNLDILNMRNIFDILQTDSSIIKVTVKFELYNKTYHITKENLSIRYDKNIDINFDLYDTYLKYKNNGLVLYYSYFKSELENKIATFVLLPNCQYYIIINNKEEDKVSFNQNIKMSIEICNKIINILNDNLNLILNKNITNFKINKLTKDNIKFYTMDILMNYNISVNEQKFNQYKNMFNEYERIGFITLANIQNDNQIFCKLNKGIYNYGDKKFIIKKFKEAKNYYEAYLDIGVNAVWKNLFGGKKLNITNSVTRISYELYNFVPDELNTAYYYILYSILELSKTSNVKALSKPSKTNYIAKSDIKKLEELDPELYAQNLGKDKVYSRIIQKKNRPIIYTKEEVEKLPDNIKKLIVKYWNFTTNEPIYYACENKEFKHFSFVTGKHPKGYCFPVCRNVKNQGKKMSQLHDKCMKDHVILNKNTQDTKVSNVLKYKDDIQINKKYKLPDTFYDTFYKLNSDSLYFLVMSSSYKNVYNVYLLKIYSHIFKIEIPEIIKDIIKKIKVYNILDFETLNLYFDSIEDLVNSLDLYFIKGNISYDTYWDSIFEEIFLYLYNISVIEFKYENKLYINIRSDINKFVNNKFIIRFNNYMVVYNKVSIFKFQDSIITDIMEIKNNVKIGDNNVINIFSYDNLFGNKKLDENKITHIYVTGKKIDCLIYDKNIYIPIYNSSSYNSNKNINNEIFIRNDYKLDWYKTYKLATSLLEHNPTFIIYNHNLEEIVDVNSLSENSIVIGFKLYNLYFWFNDVKVGTIIKQGVDIKSVEVINFEPHVINKLLTNKTKNYLEKNKEDINYKIYYNNMFKLYKIATYNYILKNMKNHTRDGLVGIIKKKDFEDNINQYMSDIIKLLKYKKDYDILIQLINDFKNKKLSISELLDNINNNQFLFDLDNVKNMKNSTIKDIKDLLYTSSKEYIKLVTKEKLKLKNNINNIITLCDGNSEFCDGKKLLLLESQFDDFVDVMAHNLLNELYSYNDIVNINFNITIDYFKFTKYPGEVIYLLF